jgi:hypothetical protein
MRVIGRSQIEFQQVCGTCEGCSDWAASISSGAVDVVGSVDSFDEINGSVEVRRRNGRRGSASCSSGECFSSVVEEEDGTMPSLVSPTMFLRLRNCQKGACLFRVAPSTTLCSDVH